MARKVVGPTGSRRRRWLFLCTTMAAIALAVLFIPSAFAVHDTGAFQLDGNASSATQPIGAPATDDWDHVCHQVLGSNCSTTSDTSGATAVSWSADCPAGQSGENCGNLNATIFTGGGSKDPQNISSWAWKDGAGGLPDKDNLLHGFAAQYSLTGPTVPAGVRTAPTRTTQA